MKKKIDYLTIIIIVLLCVASITGIFSMNFSKSFETINQYGDCVKIFGSGIYANDSYFKAPIFIGTDFCILFILVPLLISAYIKRLKNDTNIIRIKLVSLYAVSFYYGSSIAFGAKYNQLHLIYIGLFACSLFGMFSLVRKINMGSFNFEVSKGQKIFLILSGISLIVAWLPDIIPTVFSGQPLPLIENYTTEITYVLDMGIIAPLCFISLSLLKRKDNLGILLLAVILKACILVGVMMIPQGICQILSGLDLPLPVLLTKSLSFVALAGFAYYFNLKLYSKLENN